MWQFLLAYLFKKKTCNVFFEQQICLSRFNLNISFEMFSFSKYTLLIQHSSELEFCKKEILPLWH